MTTKTIDNWEYCRPQQFKERYGIGLTKFYELVKTGEINVIRIGRCTLISRAECERFFNSAQQKQAA